MLNPSLKHMQVEAKGLHHSLTTKTIQTPDGPIVSPITAAAAEYNRDSLAKTIYARLFDYIVDQVLLLARLQSNLS